MATTNPTNAPQPRSTERVTRSKTRRYLAGATLLVGGLTAGALFSPIGLASAQSGDDTSSSQPTTSDDGSTNQLGHHGQDRPGWDRHERPRLDNVAELLGITTDELRDGLQDGMSLAEMAEANGVSVEDLTAQILADIEDHLDQAVADDRIDQETADERLAAAGDRVENFITAEPGSLVRPGGGLGHTHPFGPGGPGPRIEELADSLDLSLDDLKTSFDDGQTLAEAAEAQGVSEADLVAALVATAEDRIDQAVEDGNLDADRAADIKDSLVENITERVNQVPGECEPGERGPGGGFDHPHPHPHGPGGPDGPAANANPGVDGELQDSGFSA